MAGRRHVGGGRLCHGEADEEDGSSRVGERSQSVVIVRIAVGSTCVPELKIVGFSSEWHSHGVVVKNNRDIVFGEFIQTISKEQRSFTISSITNDHTLD